MNLTDLTPAVQTILETMLCPECAGTGVDDSTYVPATHLQPSEMEQCGRCWDRPGIDSDIIRVWWCHERLAITDAIATVSSSPMPFCLTDEKHIKAGCGWVVVIPLKGTDG